MNWNWDDFFTLFFIGKQRISYLLGLSFIDGFIMDWSYLVTYPV